MSGGRTMFEASRGTVKHARVVSLLPAVAPCGFDAARARREYETVGDADARALFSRARVEFLDGNAYTSRPGPRLADAADLLARLMRG